MQRFVAGVGQAKAGIKYKKAYDDGIEEGGSTEALGAPGVEE